MALTDRPTLWRSSDRQKVLPADWGGGRENATAPLDMNEFQTHLTTQTALRDRTLADIEESSALVAHLGLDSHNLEQAREIVTAVLMATQLDAKAQIESIVSLLLQAVFGPAYRFEIEYRDLRGKSEAEFYLVKGTHRAALPAAEDADSAIILEPSKKRRRRKLSEPDDTPESAAREQFVKTLPHCGGVNDVTAFGLRLACWALSSPRSASVILADEPFRFVHGKENLERIGDALRKICEGLGLQLILVSGDDEISAVADRCWRVTKTNDVSTVEEI